MEPYFISPIYALHWFLVRKNQQKKEKGKEKGRGMESRREDMWHLDAYDAYTWFLLANENWAFFLITQPNEYEQATKQVRK